MSALRAIKPEVIQVGKPKLLLSGDAGVGKSMFALSFPTPYYIDSEGGATRPQYRKRLVDAGGVYMGRDEGAADFQTVINEVQTLATTKHQYKTLVLDSVSYLHLMEAAKAEVTVGSDYGRDKKEANKPSRQLIRWVDKIDMNVILIAHAKTKWERAGSDNKKLEYAGTTFDFYDKTEYLLDLWLEIDDHGNGKRYFTVKKTRLDQFPKGQVFPLEYSKFAELYGKEIIEKESKAIVMATPVQIEKIKNLLEVVKIPEADIQKWWTKSDVESWEEMTSVDIQAGIDKLEKRLKDVTSNKKAA